MKKDLKAVLEAWKKEEKTLLDSAKKDKVNENRLYERANTLGRCHTEIMSLEYIRAKSTLFSLPEDNEVIEFETKEGGKFTGTFTAGDDLFMIGKKKWFLKHEVLNWNRIPDAIQKS